jgi:hypothetical protein
LLGVAVSLAVSFWLKNFVISGGDANSVFENQDQKCLRP